MMKKPLLLITAILVLAACAKTIEVTGGGTEGTEETSASELTLRTVANPTKAIAEGTKVPEDNVIGFLPNFKSDIAESDIPRYDIMTFGYDGERKVWRGLGEYQQEYPFTIPLTKGIMGEIQNASYTFNPYYWPSGNRIYMDYVAYSNSNFVDLLLQLVDRYGLASNINAKIKMSKILDVYPYIYNQDPNHMNVYYNNNILNYLSMELISTFEGPILNPLAFGIVMAMCVVADVPLQGFETVGTITLEDVDKVVEAIINMQMEERQQTSIREAGTAWERKKTVKERYQEIIDQIPEELDDIWEKVSGLVDFIKDYAFASAILTETYSDYEREEALEEYEMTQKQLQEVTNKAYMYYLTYLPKVSKYIQDDLLYAYDRGLRNTGGGQVNAAFNHSKAWVKVIVNNLTDNDIIIGAVAFNDVHTGGTLIIDNSRSLFETYWDFDMVCPERSTDPIYTEKKGIDFEPYDPTTLNGENIERGDARLLSAAKNAEKKKKSEDVIDDEPSEELLNMGLIPDMYYVPAHCYGPAKQISLINPDIPITITEYADGGSVEGEVEEVEEAEPIGPVGPYLTLECYNGDTSLDEGQIGDLAKLVGGAMFPSQEPGQIAIAYYIVPGNQAQPTGTDKTVTVKREICSIIDDMKESSMNSTGSDLHTVEMNLPRVKWEMGNVYIYVLNITDSEITIDSQVTDWNSQVVKEEESSDTGSTEEIKLAPDATNWFFNKF